MTGAANLIVQRDAAGWRTIDSAPKDGTFIDVWAVNPAGRRFTGVRWHDPEVEIGAVSGPAWRDWQDVPVIDHADAVPTHWMPLPSAPGSVPTSADTIIDRRVDDDPRAESEALDAGRVSDAARVTGLPALADELKLVSAFLFEEQADGLMKVVERAIDVLQGSVPTSLAGQGTDGWDRIIATLREFASLRAADGDYWEADAAERAAKEIESIPAENRPTLSVAPQPTAGGDAPDIAAILADDSPVTDADRADIEMFDHAVTNGQAKVALRDRVREMVFGAKLYSCPIGSQNSINAITAFVESEVSDALSAERARVIEECAKWHDEQAEILHTQADEQKPDPRFDKAMSAEDRRYELHMRALHHSESAAALRALGQQDTGGAG